MVVVFLHIITVLTSLVKMKVNLVSWFYSLVIENYVMLNAIPNREFIVASFNFYVDVI